MLTVRACTKKRRWPVEMHGMRRILQVYAQNQDKSQLRVRTVSRAIQPATEDVEMFQKTSSEQKAGATQRQ